MRGGSVVLVLAVLGPFLHGWRRYVCREAQVTLIELNGERYEPSNRPRTNHNRQNPTKNKTPNTQSGKVRISGLREPKQNNVKSGETGQ